MFYYFDQFLRINCITKIVDLQESWDSRSNSKFKISQLDVQTVGIKARGKWIVFIFVYDKDA